MTHDEIIAVVAAHRDGKDIEAKHHEALVWNLITNGHPRWDFPSYDYRIAPPKPREWWINIYPDGSKSRLHASKQIADDVAHARRTECVHVREVLDTGGPA